MTLAFDVSTFAAEIGRTGVARPCHYSVFVFPPPKVLVPAFPLIMRIEGIDLPGRALTTIDQRYYGPVRSIPYAQLPTEVTMRVLLDEPMSQRELFLQWQDAIVGPNRAIGPNQSPGVFDIEYYNTYIGTVEIFKFPESPLFQRQIPGAFGGTPIVQHVTRTTLREAWPSVVGNLPLSWSDDAPLRLAVTMKCYTFTEDVVLASAAAHASAVYSQLAQRQQLSTFGFVDLLTNQSQGLIALMPGPATGFQF